MSHIMANCEADWSEVSDAKPAISFGLPLVLSICAALLAGLIAWMLGAGLLLSFVAYVCTGVVVLLGALVFHIRGWLGA